MSGTPERPLDQVLTQAWHDFYPERPNRPPWHQPTGVEPELAYTGNVVTVNLKHADQAYLHDLDRPSWEQDPAVPEDWTPASWGVG